MRCTIWIEREDGKLDGMMLHSGGEASHAGRILLSSWSSTEKVEQLLSLGHLAKLGSSLEECVSYSRDRGELMRWYHRILSR